MLYDDVEELTDEQKRELLCLGKRYVSVEAMVADRTKAAQVAAIRQRLGDIAAGAAYGGDRFALPNAIIDVFGCDVDGITPAPEPRTLDSLAAWLWERGVRG